MQVARPSLAEESVDMLAGILTGVTMEAITRNILQENHCIFLLLHTFWEVLMPRPLLSCCPQLACHLV